MMKALLQEIHLQKNYLPGEIIHTIYFGGGTPSLLKKEELQLILNTINDLFPVDTNAEITLEANPGDLSFDKLKALKNIGINRLSIGVQSFVDKHLLWMNRAHTAVQSIPCIEQAKAAGFYNFSIDLIYGMPVLSNEEWKQNVQTAIDLQIPHLSCYALTVEPKTALDNFIRAKKYPPVNSDKAAHQFELLMSWLDAAGYEHYEISNFAKPRYYSQHNSSYWQGKNYLGIGPSAHSFNGISRQWNVANNALYIKNIYQNIIPFEKEILTPAMQFNEYIMTSLRTSKGCDLKMLNEKFGKAGSEKLKAESKKFLQEKKMILQNDHLILTDKGKLFADGIAAGLFI